MKRPSRSIKNEILVVRIWANASQPGAWIQHSITGAVTRYILSFVVFLFLLCPNRDSHAAYSNYNSILIGERAAGMGGAFTALSDDASACSFYNPAAIARMEGASLSATANVYAKFDTSFGDQSELSSAPLRLNQGSIVPIPASSGSVYTFRNFAAGISIIFPDTELYAGEIRSTSDSTSTLNLRDQSLWVGGSLALNLTDQDAIGLSIYYTSRTFTRTLIDRIDPGTGDPNVTTEESFFSNNSLIYILGYWRELNPNWSLGASVRVPSVEINGRGTFFRSTVLQTHTSP